ncbi:MAG: flagellin, partial [Nitriliruptoraceae bacterium]
RISDQTQFGTKKILNGDFVKLTENEGADAVITGKAFVNDDVDSDAGGSAVDTSFELTIDGTTRTVEVDYGGSSGDTAAGLASEIQDAINTEFGSVEGFTNDDVAVSIDADSNELTFTLAAGEYADGDEVRTLGVSANSDLGLTETSASTELVVTEEEAAENVGAVFQVGANDTQQESVGMSSVSAEALGVADIDVNPAAGLDQETVDEALTQIDDAISTVSENRATLGAFQNRMESTIRNVSVAVENLSAAESRIRDTDMASEMVEFTRNQILSQAGTSMLAQANMVPQSVLSLLG